MEQCAHPGLSVCAFSVCVYMSAFMCVLVSIFMQRIELQMSLQCKWLPASGRVYCSKSYGTCMWLWLVDVHTGNASYMTTPRIYNVAVNCSSWHTINHTDSTGMLTNCCYNAEIRNLLVRTLDVDAPVKEANRLHLHEVFQVTEPNLSNRNHSIIRSIHWTLLLTWTIYTTCYSIHIYKWPFTSQLHVLVL